MWEKDVGARLAESGQVRGSPVSENAVVAGMRGSRSRMVGEEGVMSRAEESSAVYDDSELHGVRGGGVSAGSESRRFRDNARGATSFAAFGGGEVRVYVVYHLLSTSAKHRRGISASKTHGLYDTSLEGLNDVVRPLQTPSSVFCPMKRIPCTL